MITLALALVVILCAAAIRIAQKRREELRQEIAEIQELSRNY